MTRRFKQVDVFTAEPLRGNPVAVVLDADDVDTAAMQRFANWTNLSETTFVLPPTEAGADYRVRIFTPTVELPFAGHPTIGTCHAWLEAGGVPQVPGTVVQQCGVGLVELRETDGRLAFAAPPLRRGGPVDEADIADVCRVLRLARSEVVGAQWCDNGPGWLAIQLIDAAAVLALDPEFEPAVGDEVGVIGPHPLGVVGTGSADGDAAIEVRAFFRAAGGQPAEDPVTGSLNAALAQWLLPAGVLRAPYVAAQGSALGRAGRVHVDESDGEIWIGGDAVTCVDGTVSF